MVEDGYLIDYISGQEVKATPEEIEATQVFSKILVEDYGYPKKFIQTRPQYRVKIRPSDVKKEYPVDIAIFNSEKKHEDSIYIIVECKQKNRKDGKSQLEDYLRFSKAQLGVWFNGEERLNLRKFEKNGQIYFEEIPDIPLYNQRVEDIGLYKRKDLIKPTNLKSIFKTMRNYLAGNVVGATRDEVLAQQLINVIFCKIYDEKFTKPEDMISFRAGIEEKEEDVANRIYELFDKVKNKYSDVLDETDSISKELDPKSINYIVGSLQKYCLKDAERDAIGDAFEVFIGHALKGEQGQFFTPRNVVKMIVDMMDIKLTDKIIDPCCGSGGFLIESLRSIWKKADKEYGKLNWPESEIEIEKQKIAIENFRGIDKDYFLSKVCKAQMAILGDGRAGIFCENSLEVPAVWKRATQEKITLNSFDVLITNPPYGSKIKVVGNNILSQYDLAKKWSFDKKKKEWISGKVKESDAPQYLFVERCLQFLKPGGRMALVLPDGIFGNDKLAYIRNYITQNARILAIIDIPKETFMPHTSTKTSVILMQKNENNSKSNEDYNVFMAVCETCGHDRRGNIDEDKIDDISLVAEKYNNWRKSNDINL